MTVAFLLSLLVLAMIDRVSCLQCYRCGLYQPRNGCSQTTYCGRDQVCYISLARPTTGETVYQSGCIGKQVCQNVMSTVVGRRSVVGNQKACFNCCSTPNCNSDCNVTTTPTSTSATVPVSTPCVDFTSPTTCKIASSVVCKDITIAANAGCRHFCGLC